MRKTAYVFVKITERLLDGISTILSNLRVCSFANFSTSFIFRNPQSLFLSLKLLSNAILPAAVGTLFCIKGP